VIVGGTVQEKQKELGGKGLHLELLSRGGFKTPETYFLGDVPELPNSRLYIVRSSAADEDGHTKTSAGKYVTIKGVSREDLESACRNVQSHYEKGNVIIQPDLSDSMQFSGVVYSNLNGNVIISGGRNSFVQRIVDGEAPETEISFSNGKSSLQGMPLNPNTIQQIRQTTNEVEKYFGIPMDIEFAIIEDKVTLLQARPLPNPTDSALREHEIGRVRDITRKVKSMGLDELVLGAGNYREILANNQATHLSTSTFNYAFSGDGKKTLGAVQLGRNELGYDIGTEIFPWVIMANGKVYYNFAGDALQFRPEGIKKEDFLCIVNETYLPIVRGNPDLLNYPELRLYIQFPEQAEQVGLDPEPFRRLAKRNREAISDLKIPDVPPVKKIAKKYNSLEECLREAHAIVDNIRVGSAREYVKAARLAFFALEDIRTYLEREEKENPKIFQAIVNIYGKNDPEQLRDAIVYDESIGSFEVEECEEYKYLGSFELSQPRGFPPKRRFKKGRDIPDKELAELTAKTRDVLEYREKVKFSLFRDYDYLKQLYEQVGDLSSFGSDIFYLEFSELRLLKEEPRLAMYRIELRKQIKERKLLPDPIFESELEMGIRRTYEKKPQLIFGSLSEQEMYVKIGEQGYIVDSVDQTVEIPQKTSVVLVPDNVRPGSHLFTVLSDYGLPVVGVPQEELDLLRDSEVQISYKDGYVDIKRRE